MRRNLYTIECWLHKHTTSRHAGKHIHPALQVESAVSFCQLNVNGTMWKIDWTAETRSSSHISVFQDVWFWGTVGRAYRACPKSCICTIANSRAFPESSCFFTSLPERFEKWRLLGVELSPLNYQLYELSFFPQITWLTAWNSRVSPYLINLITVSVRFLLTEWQSFTLCTASACCYKRTKTCWSKEHLSSFINEKISVTNNCMRSEKVRYCQSIVSMSWWLFFN